MRSVRVCLSFVGMCLWAMSTQEIQGYPLHEQFWNSLYNSQMRPMKPASNAMQFPWYYFHHPGYPNRFLSVPINNVQPHASNIWLQNGKRPIGNGRRINSANGIASGFAGTINFQPVPMGVFPTMSQQMTTQQERGTWPRNEEAAPTEKSEESSAGRGVSSTPEYSAETTRTYKQQGEENLREESSTNEPIELDRKSVSPVCQGNCEDAHKDSVSILIEEALRNGELLRSDEWIKRQNATMKYRARKSEQREEEALRKKSAIESTELDRGLVSCRGNCADVPGSNISRVIDETLSNGESSRDDEWSVKESRSLHWGPAPVCSNSTFCMHATYYPEELINQAIRRNDSLRLFQSVDPVSEVDDRLEFDELNDSPFCGSYVRLIYPKSAETMNQRWLYVVNQDNLRQGVRIEMCANEGSVCGDLDDYLPGGYKAFCKQKYIYRELVAVDNGIVKKDTFRFPSSCCCHREFVR